MPGDDGPRVVVVGGGPCAAVAARELVRAGHNVTMVDAGGRAPRGLLVHVAGRTVVRWVEGGYLHEDRHRAARDPATMWTSSLSHGGLSNFWAGAVLRFAPGDFVEGAAIDERFRWPITYDDLVPFYDLVEDDLRITAGDDFANIPASRAEFHWRPPADWRRLIETARRHGHSLAPLPLAKGSPWMIAMRPREFSSHQCVVRQFLDAPNFRLVSHARVVRIGYSTPTGRADSVTYVGTAGGAVHSVPADAVVVAAGALDSTEILLRSVSADFPTGLGNTNNVLGRYLHDHPREWWPARLERPLTAIHHPIHVSRTADTAGNPLLAASLTMGIGSFADRLRNLAHSRTRRLGVQVLGTMVPSEEVGVSLVEDHDPDDHRSTLRIDMSFDSDATATVHGARERFRQIFDEVGSPVAIGPFHELIPGESVHFGGTVRMHRDPQFGVLDAWNRLHDVPNVVVGDASSFTTGPEKNPTLTAMAISARAARHLAESLS